MDFEHTPAAQPAVAVAAAGDTGIRGWGTKIQTSPGASALAAPLQQAILGDGTTDH